MVFRTLQGSNLFYRPCLRHLPIQFKPSSLANGSTSLTNLGWLNNRSCLRHFVEKYSHELFLNSPIGTTDVLASRFNGWKIMNQICLVSPIGTGHIFIPKKLPIKREGVLAKYPTPLQKYPLPLQNRTSLVQNRTRSSFNRTSSVQNRTRSSFNRTGSVRNRTHSSFNQTGSVQNRTT